jgi:uncharacterized membrane protein
MQRPSTREGRISGVKTPRASWMPLSVLLATSGVLHFVKPKPYDRMIPRGLGDPRPWVQASGAAELAVATALVHPATRSLAGWAAAALLVGIFPGNVTMATRAAGSTRASTKTKALLVARLPLQAPLVWWAVDVAQRARNEP